MLFNELDGTVRAIARDEDNPDLLLITVEIAGGARVMARLSPPTAQRLGLRIDQRVHLEFPIDTVRLGQRGSQVLFQPVDPGLDVREVTARHQDPYSYVWDVTATTSQRGELLARFLREVEVTLYAEPIDAQTLEQALEQARQAREHAQIPDAPPAPRTPRITLAISLVEPPPNSLLRLHLGMNYHADPDVQAHAEAAMLVAALPADDDLVGLIDSVRFADTTNFGSLDIDYEVSGAAIGLALDSQTRAGLQGSDHLRPPLVVVPGSSGTILIIRDRSTRRYRLSLEVTASFG